MTIVLVALVAMPAITTLSTFQRWSLIHKHLQMPMEIYFRWRQPVATSVSLLSCCLSQLLELDLYISQMMLGTSVHRVSPKYLRTFNLTQPCSTSSSQFSLHYCYTFSFYLGLEVLASFQENYPILSSLYHNHLSNFHLIFKSFKVIDDIHLKNNFSISFWTSLNTSVTGKQIWKKTTG